MGKIIKNGIEYGSVLDKQYVPVESTNIDNYSGTIFNLVKNIYPEHYHRWYTTTDGATANITDRPTGTTNLGLTIEAFIVRNYTGSSQRYRVVCRTSASGTGNVETYECIVDREATSLSWSKLINSRQSGTVSSTLLADNAVTTAKINGSAVTTAKIADANVTTAKIADKAVTLAKVDRTSSGAWNEKIAVVSGNVLEVCKYIDFHNTNTSTNDYDTRLQCEGATKNVLKLPTVSGNLISTGTPTWSTFCITSNASTTGTFTSLRGNKYNYRVENGGTQVIITSGLSSIKMFRQSCCALYTTKITGNIGVGGLQASSKAYIYARGDNNGSFYNNAFSYTTGTEKYAYTDCIVSTGGKANMSFTLTGIRCDNSNTWQLHTSIQCGGYGFAANFQCECLATDVNTSPTIYQRGATASNVSVVLNTIEILEV